MSPMPNNGWRKQSKCIFNSDRRFEFRRIRDIQVRDIESRLYFENYANGIFLQKEMLLYFQNCLLDVSINVSGCLILPYLIYYISFNTRGKNQLACSLIIFALLTVPHYLLFFIKHEVT